VAGGGGVGGARVGACVAWARGGVVAGGGRGAEPAHCEVGVGFCGGWVGCGVVVEREAMERSASARR